MGNDIHVRFLTESVFLILFSFSINSKPRTGVKPKSRSRCTAASASAQVYADSGYRSTNKVAGRCSKCKEEINDDMIISEKESNKESNNLTQNNVCLV